MARDARPVAGFTLRYLEINENNFVLSDRAGRFARSQIAARVGERTGGCHELRALHRRGGESRPRGRRREFGGRRDNLDRKPAGRREPKRGRPDRLPSRKGNHGRDREENRGQNRAPRRQSATPPKPLEIVIRFLPRSAPFDNVVTQIKSGTVAYSLFHLARLFLEKPERYEVRLTTTPELPLHQLGEDGVVALDPEYLDRNAFRLAQGNFFKVEISQGEPIKGNFTSVARDRLSGILLGPTNHHAYQPRLRTLYEQRFSRRMSFADYQRQIEVMSDPALVERWKEEAQRVTTYSTLHDETPLTFSSAADAEKHFRANYLPGLVRRAEEITIGGVVSRNLSDRVLHRIIEDGWSRETRSPSNIMQELATRFRQAGLHVFRHRRGMLFVSPIRVHALAHDKAGISPSVNAILQTLAEGPGLNRKKLADKVIVDPGAEDAETRKRTLASDLHWLIGAGHVIEFNDGSLDLPREKAKPQEVASVAAVSESTEQTPSTQNTSTTPGELEIGGS